MIIILPLLTLGTVDQSAQFAINALHAFNINTSINNASKTAALQCIIDNTQSDTIPDNYLLRLRMNPFDSGYSYVDSGIKKITKSLKHNITNTYIDPIYGTHYYTSGLFTQVNYAKIDAQYSISKSYLTFPNINEAHIFLDRFMQF
jgi:hypothetical protein